VFHHDECPKPSLSSPLPTRVLSLAPDLGAHKVRVLVTEGRCAQYAALSYCWGRTPQLTTTQERLASFVDDGIEIARLPRTLQDAITVARKLGIMYLWIDSLCIIQDSDEDKAIEITKMPQIYKGAIVTISAAIAQDCGDGFLEARQEIQEILNSVFALEYLLLEEGGAEGDPVREVHQEDTDTIFVCADADCGYKIKDFDEEHINKRGWTLQESWLAPRLLIYGSGPLQWQCLTKSASFGGSPPSGTRESVFPIKSRREFFRESDPGIPNRGVEHAGSLSDQWRTIVSHYTRRAITDPRDKLPALSGIAAEFGRLSNDEYLAGLWKSSLPYSLLWHQTSRPPPGGSGEISPYRAPSWSWASLDGAIMIESPRTWASRTEVTVEAAHTSALTALAPLGQVVAGTLTLTGPVHRMSWPQVQQRYVILDLGKSAHLVRSNPIHPSILPPSQQTDRQTDRHVADRPR